MSVYNKAVIDIVTKIKLWIIVFEVLVIGKACFNVFLCVETKAYGGILGIVYQLLIELGVCVILEWMGELLTTLKGIKSKLEIMEE